MHEYDVALKVLLRGRAGLALQSLTGSAVKTWLDIELPKVQNPRVDLLGELSEGGLLHLELQSGNDRETPVRMAEYALGIYRRFRQFPRQIVLYVGERAIGMQPEMSGVRFSFSYELADIRDLEGDTLLSSPHIGDNVLAILTRLRDRRSAVAEIVRRITGLDTAERGLAIAQLMILAGLRGLEETVEEEVRKMPILNDIMEHKVLGREFRRGKAEGLHLGELAIVRKLIVKRFGTMPSWADESISAKSAEELEALSDRLMDAPSLEDLLR